MLLARKYGTLIVVNQARMKYIQCMNMNKEMFSMKESAGWIEIVPKSQKDKKLQDNRGSIAITLTGWANIP